MSTKNKMSTAQESFLRKHKREILLVNIYRLIVFIAFFGLWEVSSRLKLIDSFIFSSPSRIIKTFYNMLMDGSIFYHTGITIFETLVSFSLGSILGIIIAIILWWNKTIAKVLEPYLVVLNSLPKTALAPILIVWLGNNMKSIIFTALTVSIVVTILNVYNGFINVEEDMIKLIYTFNGKKQDVLKKVILPSNIPTIISTMKINIGLSLIGVIIGEFLAAKAGLGYLIVYGSQVFRLDWVMMSIILLALLATALYQGIVFIEKRIKRY
ncbi:NitT/TauT family transport system permease protein [Natranaerovirga pectinivora]|uniref:NitT/TauT family transport system permease protein n=1 Tax=Natranaerovirga pectinivora TaxID=682400 RepID=A0A4R3MJN2_9FIRM|nr:ABC transporter permease [Natranaerovirga pectinivora]TCT14619.1 NitT/TauT family transport system permease protein [Natranaerovirga pectinivora]